MHFSQCCGNAAPISVHVLEAEKQPGGGGSCCAIAAASAEPPHTHPSKKLRDLRARAQSPVWHTKGLAGRAGFESSARQIDARRAFCAQSQRRHGPAPAGRQKGKTASVNFWRSEPHVGGSHQNCSKALDIKHRIRIILFCFVKETFEFFANSKISVWSQWSDSAVTEAWKVNFLRFKGWHANSKNLAGSRAFLVEKRFLGVYRKYYLGGNFWQCLIALWKL